MISMAWHIGEGGALRARSPRGRKLNEIKYLAHPVVPGNGPRPPAGAPLKISAEPNMGNVENQRSLRHDQKGPHRILQNRHERLAEEP